MLVSSGGVRILVDASRHFDAQSRWIEGPLDAVLLTHAHRDASGGLPRLARWQAIHDGEPLRVLASAETIAIVRGRHRRLAPLALTALASGKTTRIGCFSVTPLIVPHARDPLCSTYAWRLCGPSTIVYASDVARLERRLRCFAQRAELLIIDGAMWGRPLFSHLRIDRELPALCRWSVERIVVTQIGRSAPPHHELQRRMAALCTRAIPAYDGLQIET